MGKSFIRWAGEIDLGSVTTAALLLLALAGLEEILLFLASEEMSWSFELSTSQEDSGVLAPDSIPDDSNELDSGTQTCVL